jgi:hypothetical protein
MAQSDSDLEALRALNEAWQASIVPPKERALKVGTRVRIVKGCKARSVTKGATAMITRISEMGPEYGYSVAISFKFQNSFLAGKTLVFYARHPNRLDDAIVNLNDGRPEHKIQIQKV